MHAARAPASRLHSGRVTFAPSALRASSFSRNPHLAPRLEISASLRSPVLSSLVDYTGLCHFHAEVTDYRDTDSSCTRPSEGKLYPGVVTGKNANQRASLQRVCDNWLRVPTGGSREGTHQGRRPHQLLCRTLGSAVLVDCGSLLIPADQVPCLLSNLSIHSFPQQTLCHACGSPSILSRCFTRRSVAPHVIWSPSSTIRSHKGKALVRESLPQTRNTLRQGGAPCCLRLFIPVVSPQRSAVTTRDDSFVDLCKCIVVLG